MFIVIFLLSAGNILFCLLYRISMRNRKIISIDLVISKVWVNVIKIFSFIVLEILRPYKFSLKLKNWSFSETKSVFSFLCFH